MFLSDHQTALHTAIVLHTVNRAHEYERLKNLKINKLKKVIATYLTNLTFLSLHLSLVMLIINWLTIG